MSRSVSRRSFLAALGAVGAAMPFARLLERSALAQSAPPPQRFVACRIGNGTPLEFWRPQPGFVINGLNQSLQPFDDAATYGMSFKNKLVVVDGIRNVVADESSSGGHASGPCIFTGSVNTVSGGNAPKNESLETYLGVTQKLGNATAFPTILHGVGTTSAFGAGGVPLDTIGGPAQLFHTVFANYQSGSQTPQQMADALARGQSVLDFVSGSLQGLQARLGPTERTLLDQHLTAIRQIENRLTSPPPVCASAPMPPMCPQYSDCLENNTNGDTINQMVVDILAQAIVCDLTRFIQMRLVDPGTSIGSSTQDPGVSPALPIAYPMGKVCSDNPSNPQDCDHLDVGHKYVISSPFTLGGGSGGNGAADVTSQIRLARLNKYYHGYLASFAQQLAAAGLLDSTLIVTSSDVGNPARHDCINLPTILLGGANGKLKMGQYIKLSQDTPQNLLYVSIANAFGINIKSYGTSANTSTTTGTIAGLAA